MAAILQTTTDGKAATPRPGPSPNITLLPDARQHPKWVKKVGLLALYQRPLTGPDSLKQAPCREPEVAVALPTERNAREFARPRSGR